MTLCLFAGEKIYLWYKNLVINFLWTLRTHKRKLVVLTNESG